MKHSTRLLFNTVATYVRIVVNTLVTLLSTRVALGVLGANDFGLYNLISGVVVMLSFMNGAMMISSQRYFSLAIGAQNHQRLNSLFNASITLHALIAGIWIILLVGISPLLFGGFLNIESSQSHLAIQVYFVAIISGAFSFVGIPFSAMMNAYEDLVALSISEIIVCLGKLLAALSLLVLTTNLLLVYSVGILLAVVFGVAINATYCNKKYRSLSLQRALLKDKATILEIIGFAGWNTLGSIAVLVRTQGIALVLNVFFGTVINAAYGIANQVNSLVLSFASTLTSVFTPSIIQAKGFGDHEKMMRIAVFSSKLSFFLSSLLALPILIFTRPILELWLDHIPEKTLEFSQYSILSFLILQLYPGVNRAIYAVGEIRGYQIAISVAMVAILPIGWYLFKLGYAPEAILLLQIISQITCLIITLCFSKVYCFLDVRRFIFRSVLVPVLIFNLVWIGSSSFLERDLQDSTIFPIIFWSIALGGGYSIFLFLLMFSQQERTALLSLIRKK